MRVYTIIHWVGLKAWQTISNFRTLASSIESVYLVEASPSLREKQKTLLCGDAAMQEINIGFRSQSKYFQVPITWCEDIRFVPNGSAAPIDYASFSLTLHRCLEITVHYRP